MGFISKVELRRQLMSMGVKLEGNYVRKSDISKLILADHASWEISLLQKVPTLPYAKVTNKVWNTIQDEGLDEEFEVSRQDLSYADLPLSEDIQSGLKQLDDQVVERFNAFDIALKEKYGKKYTDFIDYDLGRVLIVRVDTF